MLSISGDITFKPQTLLGDFQPIPTPQPYFPCSAIVEIKFEEIPLNSNNNNNNSISNSLHSPLQHALGNLQCKHYMHNAPNRSSFY